MKAFAAIALLVVWVTVVSSAPAEKKKRSADASCTVNDQVYESGSTFTLPDQDCFVYRCQDGSTSLVSSGCKASNGQCRDVGQSWTVGCATFQCMTEVREDGQTYFFSKLTSGGCQDSSGTCHGVGETWPAATCSTYKCESQVQDGKTYYATTIDSLECKDADGICHAAGETFPMEFGDTRYEKCTCSITGTSISYSCSG